MNRDGFGRLGARAVALAGAGLVALALAVFGLANLKAMRSVHGALGEKFRVVTIFTVIQDMAQNVAGDKAKVVSITKPGADIDDYQPTLRRYRQGARGRPRPVERLQSRAPFEKFFQNVSDVPSVTLTEGVEAMGISEGPYSASRTRMPGCHPRTR